MKIESLMLHTFCSHGWAHLKLRRGSPFIVAPELMLTGLCTNEMEALGRKTHFTPEWLFADWNWCLCQRILVPRIILAQNIPQMISHLDVWLQFPTEIVRLYLHQIIYFLNFILLIFRTVLKLIPLGKKIYIYLCVHAHACTLVISKRRPYCNS